MGKVFPVIKVVLETVAIEIVAIIALIVIVGASLAGSDRADSKLNLPELQTPPRYMVTEVYNLKDFREALNEATGRGHNYVDFSTAYQHSPHQGMSVVYTLILERKPE